MITGTIVGDRELLARFDRFPARLRQELRIAINRAGLRVQRHSKESKLSGQVLKVQTGRLRRSINLKITEEPAAVQATVGTNVSYARVHEFGFKGVVTVREHLRRAKGGVTSTVRAHPRNVDMPERSFLRSALADLRTEVRAELQGRSSKGDPMNREVIYAALFDRLKVVADFKTASRRVKSWTEVAAPDQPALFQSQRREQAQTTPGLHTVWLLLVDLYLYANTNGSENVSPGQILNPLVDAVIGALAIDDITKNKCTLGGLVEHAWVEGNIETDEGALGDQGVVIIPIVIKVTGV